MSSLLYGIGPLDPATYLARARHRRDVCRAGQLHTGSSSRSDEPCLDAGSRMNFGGTQRSAAMIDISIRRRYLSVIIHTGLAFVLGLTIVAQAPVGFDLALVDVDGTRKVLGRLPPSTYAPRVSPDGKRIAFETRDPSGPDGRTAVGRGALGSRRPAAAPATRGRR